MNNIYIESGYNVCKSIGDFVNFKENKAKKCNTKEDLSNRISFLLSHNLFTFMDIAVDKSELQLFSDEEKYKKLNDKLKRAVFRQLKCDLMSDNISQNLSKSAVRHIVLKGVEFKRFYPIDVVRTSNDIDIYISKSELKKAQKVLNDMGFVFEKTYDNISFLYKKEPRYCVELHTDMEGFNDEQKRILKSFADNAVKMNSTRYSLNDNDFYIYSLFHLYKHFVLSGAGVRMFLDVYLIRKNGALDYEYIAPILKKIGIEGFENAVEKVNSCLFEGTLADNDIKDVIEFVFDSGTFGKASSNQHLKKINIKTTGTNRMQRIKNNNGLGFDAMKKRYPVLERFPVLYPFSFIHRFFYGIIHKRDVLINEIEVRKSISKDRVDKYDKIFKTMQINKAYEKII